MRTISLPALTTLYKSLSLLFSMTGCMQLRLGVKRSRSGHKSVLFVQTNLKRRDTTKTQSPAGAGASAHDMKEEDVVEEVDPNISSSLSEERKKAARKCLKEMPLVGLIYDVDF